MIRKLLYALCATFLLCAGTVMSGNTLASDSMYVAEQSQFKVWKTIRLGTGLKTSDDFRRALHGSGNSISTWGGELLNSPAFSVSDREKTVGLVRVTVAELGFKNGATIVDIYKRAQELGLGLCPAEVGPQLRLQYWDQPMGEWLIVGMKPVTDSDGYLNVFYVGRFVDGRWLDGDFGYPGRFWYGYHRFVFVSRK